MLLSWRGMTRRLTAVLHLDDAPRKIALGLAVGVFIGCTPLYGLHTLLAIVVAALLRVNKVATVTGTWLNLPWFAPFVYGLSLKVGEFILSGGQGLEFLHGEGLGDLASMIRPYLSIHRLTQGFLASSQLLFVASKPLFVGTTVVGVVAGVVTYVVALGAIREVRHMAHLHPSDNPPSEG